jgi:hypothetical protein
MTLIFRQSEIRNPHSEILSVFHQERGVFGV